jgi:hypothetical protein
MSLWKGLFGKKAEVAQPTGPSPFANADQHADEPLSRMGRELDKATRSQSIEGVIIDAYPGHEMSCPVHGEGGVDIFTGQKKHQFRIEGDRVVCTRCGSTAINPSKGNRPWTGVANDTNLQLIIAHRQAILNAFEK